MDTKYSERENAHLCGFMHLTYLCVSNCCAHPAQLAVRDGGKTPQSSDTMSRHHRTKLARAACWNSRYGCQSGGTLRGGRSAIEGRSGARGLQHHPCRAFVVYRSVKVRVVVVPWKKFTHGHVDLLSRTDGCNVASDNTLCVFLCLYRATAETPLAPPLRRTNGDLDLPLSVVE